MPYTYYRPTSVSFTSKGLSGYTLGPLNQKDLEIYYIESEKGHDTFTVSKKITHTYYVLSGGGFFTIDNERHPVCAGALIEVPPKVEYSYSGKMTLLCLSIPRWFDGNDKFTRWNPDVLTSDAPCVANDSSWMARLGRVKIFGKSPVSAYLRLNRWLWNKAPAKILNISPIVSYGKVLHKLECRRAQREQRFETYFHRNRPELELIRRLVDRKKRGETLSVTVWGCSTGAEAYSVAWRIRSARPDLRLVLHAVDVSKTAVEVAKSGVYSLTAPQLTCAAIFKRMTAAEMDELFDRDAEAVTVKSWIKEGIDWRVGDAGDPETLELLGPQDIVLANNFLCHMGTSEAERCLRNIARSVRPDGYLFVSGIDLDVRERVAGDLGWEPLQDLLEEIHEGDLSVRNCWPWHYTGLEPFNRRRPDWRIRYAAGFQLASNRADGGHGSEIIEQYQDSLL
jgi:chemotaxis methyl-accepting protein methylase/mannose-6-phosphate isomerase-like protein (cupin superfamily)